jgi:transposase
MEQRKVIGIDPDSKGFQCVYMKEGDRNLIKKHFYVDKIGLETFVKWVFKIGNTIIAIEGSNGQSRPIEKALKENGIVFHSFKPSSVTKYRRAVLGENKNNDRDAEATAGLALSLANQGRLTNFKRVWFPEDGLRQLTRMHEKITQNKTAAINSLWKLIRIASPDLYLMLKGREMDEEEGKKSKLDNENLLKLFKIRPDFSEWKSLSETELFEAMGRKNLKGVAENIKRIKKIAQHISPVDSSIHILVNAEASQILFYNDQLKIISKEIKKKAENNKSIQNLTEIKGFGINTAAKIVAEIIDIRRFLSDDNLASYSSFGRKTDDTGETKREKENYMFNRRLKNVFITAAKNFVRFNPDHHLTGYFRYLVDKSKRGMDKTEAYKRVARALVRIVFKRLYGLLKIIDPDVTMKDKEGGMANGKTRNTNVLSNIPPSSKVNVNDNKRRCQTKKVEIF